MHFNSFDCYLFVMHVLNAPSSINSYLIRVDSSTMNVGLWSQQQFTFVCIQSTVVCVFAPFVFSTPNSLHCRCCCCCCFWTAARHGVTIRYSLTRSERLADCLTAWWLADLWGLLYKCNHRQIIHLIWTHSLNGITPDKIHLQFRLWNTYKSRIRITFAHLDSKEETKN